MKARDTKPNWGEVHDGETTYLTNRFVGVYMQEFDHQESLRNVGGIMDVVLTRSLSFLLILFLPEQMSL